MIEKVQFYLARKVGDRGKVLEHFRNAVLQEFVVRRFLHLDKVRHIYDFVHLRKRASFGLAVLYLSYCSCRH